MTAACQVDFYVLEASAPSARHLACRLCLKAWEEGHRISVLTNGEEDARSVDELMWEFPEGRFLPHEVGTKNAGAPVAIVSAPDALTDDRDVVINLSAQPVSDPNRFRRLLEIVPADERLRESSRSKFREYRDLGLAPKHHRLQTF